MPENSGRQERISPSYRTLRDYITGALAGVTAESVDRYYTRLSEMEKTSYRELLAHRYNELNTLVEMLSQAKRNKEGDYSLSELMRQRTAASFIADRIGVELSDEK